MEIREKLEQFVKEEIYKLRNLGEHARRGSDHLYYRSLSQLKIGELKILKDSDELTYELVCIYDIYTETEFMHDPNMDDYLKEHYEDKFIFDKNLKLLEIKDTRNIR